MSFDFILCPLLLIAALLAATVPRAVHAGLWMSLALALVGAVYLTVGADFLGLVQFTVYVGAVAVLMIFTLLITRREDELAELRARGKSVFIWFACVVPVLVVLVAVAFAERAPGFPGALDLPLKVLGHELFTTYAPVVLALAMLLTAVLVGAAMIARDESPAAFDEND